MKIASLAEVMAVTTSTKFVIFAPNSGLFAYAISRFHYETCQEIRSKNPDDYECKTRSRRVFVHEFVDQFRCQMSDDYESCQMA